jgi:hypothetical protein
MAKMPKWRRHDENFKRQVVERMKTCQNITELARELNVQRKLLYTWKYQFEGRPEPRHADLAVTAEDRKVKQLRDQIAKLERAVAEATVENRFFRTALLKVKQARQQNIASGVPASTKPSSRGRQSKAR